MRDENLTAATLRVLQKAARMARNASLPEVQPQHLLMVMLGEETRAVEVLAKHGLQIEADDSYSREAEGESQFIEWERSQFLSLVVQRARLALRKWDSGGEIGTEHLLLALARTSAEIADWLADHQISIEKLEAEIEERSLVPPGLVPAEFALEFQDDTRTVRVDTLRILDASANRAREGLRVLEDHARFVLDDRHLTERLKGWRHEFARVLGMLPTGELLAARETEQDVGTQIHTAREQQRGSLAHVLIANWKRVQEAVRSLEEFGKIFSSDFAKQIEQLRYQLYTLEKASLQTLQGRNRLDGQPLYLLVTEELCHHGSGPAIRDACAGGVSIVQLREKHLADRELLQRARRVREWTRDAGALFIMNDRPDLAVLCDADGVHVGQDELSVRDARRIVGSDRLVGVSTHTIEQARQAVLDGADYIGVGPCFPTQTKSFTEYAGLDFVRAVAAEITLPAFAIGGITLENVSEVLAAGATRIAVSGAICRAAKPREVARQFANHLPSSPPARSASEGA